MTEKKPKPDLVDDERTLWIGAAVAAVVFVVALIVSVHPLLALLLGLILFAVFAWILHVNLGFEFPRFGGDEASGSNGATRSVDTAAGIGAAPLPPVAPAASTRVSEPATEPAAEAEAETEAKPEAAAAPEPAARKDAAPAPRRGPAVRPTTPLPGEVDLDARKGEWSYTPDKEAAADTTTAPAADTPGRPRGLDAPRDGGKDDLKRIKGVGPKLEQLLNDMGYFHFDQIAGWTETEIAWVDDNLEGFKGRVTRDDWVGQARELASGG